MRRRMYDARIIRALATPAAQKSGSEVAHLDSDSPFYLERASRCISSTPGMDQDVCRFTAMSVLASVDSFAARASPRAPLGLVQRAADLVRASSAAPPCEHQRPGPSRRSARSARRSFRRKRDRLDDGYFAKMRSTPRGRVISVHPRPVAMDECPASRRRAPLCGRAAVEHHLRTVARALGKDRRESC